MGRAPCCDKANVKRGPWSPEEDATLRSYVQKNGTGGNWIALPQKAGLKRCGKSCRLRWLNYLRPDIKHGGFTDEEDGIICSLYRSLGSRWSVIASQLPGRTDNDVKNYWNTKLKKKLMSAKPSAPAPPPPAAAAAAISAGPPLLPPLPCSEPPAGPAFWPAPAYFSSPTPTDDASLAASSLTTDGSSGGGGLWAAENDAIALMDAASDSLDWPLQSWIETPAPFFPGAWAAAGEAYGLPELYGNISYT